VSAEVRLYTDADEVGVGEALQAAFGRWPGDVEVDDPRAYFRWKHLESPLGRSLMIVAEADGGVVGFCGWIPNVFTVGGRELRALRGVDLSVRPGYQGRGIAAAIVEAGTRHVPPGTSFTLSNPNEVSRGGVLRLGRRPVGRFPTFVRFRKPLRAILGRGTSAGATASPPVVEAEEAATVLGDVSAVSALLARISRPADRLASLKTAELLRWRYGSLGLYHAVRLERDGVLAGIAVLRLRRSGPSWNTRICEVLVADGDAETARRLVRGAVRAADVVYATCHFPPGSVQRRAATRCGFVRSRHGERIVSFKLDPEVTPDPVDHRSWALSLGDLDIV
jgi:GNAT superfamily N-acetyltransferase